MPLLEEVTDKEMDPEQEGTGSQAVPDCQWPCSAAAVAAILGHGHGHDHGCHGGGHDGAAALLPPLISPRRPPLLVPSLPTIYSSKQVATAPLPSVLAAGGPPIGLGKTQFDEGKQPAGMAEQPSAGSAAAAAVAAPRSVTFALEPEQLPATEPEFGAATKAVVSDLVAAEARAAAEMEVEPAPEPAVAATVSDSVTVSNSVTTMTPRSAAVLDAAASAKQLEAAKMRQSAKVFEDGTSMVKDKLDQYEDDPVRLPNPLSAVPCDDLEGVALEQPLKPCSVGPQWCHSVGGGGGGALCTGRSNRRADGEGATGAADRRRAARREGLHRQLLGPACAG